MNEQSDEKDPISQAIDRVATGQGDLTEAWSHPSAGLRFWIFRDPTCAEGAEMFAKPAHFAPLSPGAVAVPACSARPPEYPAAVPFLPLSAVVVNPLGDGVQAIWGSCPNPLQGLRSILDQSRAEGWEGPGGDDVPLASREDRLFELEVDGRVRTVRLEICGSAGILTLIDVGPGAGIG